MIQEKLYNATYSFSCIEVYKRPDDGLQLEPKHRTVKKLVTLVLCVTDLIRVLLIVNTNRDVSTQRWFVTAYFSSTFRPNM